MKKLFGIVSALLLAFILTACTTTAAAITVLNWNIGAEPDTIDPVLNGASDGGDVINQTFEGLTREVGGVVSPGIASSWDISTDGLTVTFHLRASKWSDGSDLTAADFIYSWKRGMDPLTASEYSWIWEYTNIVGAYEAVYDDGPLSAVGLAAPDPLTLVVTLTRRTPYIVSLLSFYHFLPTKQSAVETDDDSAGAWAIDPTKVVCNGPFVLTGYVTGSGLTLTKNEHYWDAANIHLTTINAKFIDDDASAYFAFQQETLDFIPSVPAAMVPTLIVEDPEFYQFPLLGTYYVNFNMNDNLFSNLNLRKAMIYAINREEICETLSAGQLPATGFVGPGFLDHDGKDFGTEAGTYGIPTDGSGATQAVAFFAAAAADLSMTVPQLQAAVADKVYKYNTGSGHQMVGEMIQASWKTVLGIDTLEIQNMLWATLQNDRTAGNYDISRGGWLTDFMDPAGMLAIFMVGNSYNDPDYNNPAFDNLMDEALAADTLAVHFEKMYAAQDLLMVDLPFIPIYYYTDTMMAQSYLKDWDRSILGTIDLTRAYIQK